MDSGNFKWYAELARNVQGSDFRIQDNLGERMPGLAHLLCAMSRYSSHGLSGAAFRHWVAGVFRDGVYVFADNYRVDVAFASDPTATVSPGCDDSCVHGDPKPRLSNGRWIGLTREDVPDAIHQKVSRIANRLIREAALDVLRRADELEAELAAASKRRTARHEAMVAAWENCGKEPTP